MSGFAPEALAAGRPRMVAVATRILRDRTDAEDAVQEALLATFRAGTVFRAEAHPTSYLARAAITRAYDHGRRRRRRRAHEVADAAMLGTPAEAVAVWGTPAHAQPERLLYAREIGEAIAAALDRLTWLQRRVFEMREMEGREYADIASVLSVSVITVRTTLHRAKLALQARLVVALGRRAVAA